MPIYEYRCLDCKKRSSILVLNRSNTAAVRCTHCQSPRLERLLSRFASPKSEEARMESLADPSALAGLDENDPDSMERFMKNMKDELGEEAGEDMAESMDSPTDAADGVNTSDSL